VSAAYHQEVVARLEVHAHPGVAGLARELLHQSDARRPVFFRSPQQRQAQEVQALQVPLLVALRGLFLAQLDGHGGALPHVELQVRERLGQHLELQAVLEVVRLEAQHAQEVEVLQELFGRHVEPAARLDFRVV
jgi:hypothetical protein